MLDECLPMGCLSSRSTTVSPGFESGQLKGEARRQGGPAERTNRLAGNMNAMVGKRQVGGNQRDGEQERPRDNYSDSGTVSNVRQKRIVNIGTSLDRQSDSGHSEAVKSDNEPENDFMTILMSGNGGGSGGNGGKAVSESQGHPETRNSSISNKNNTNNHQATRSAMSSGNDKREREDTFDDLESSNYLPSVTQNELKPTKGNGATINNNSMSESNNDSDQVAVNITTERSVDGESGASSLEEELNMDLLRQYIVVDFEISQLEDRDALRMYHEKIEQLEQLERELDMISFEAEEVAVRSESGLSRSERNQSASDDINNMTDNYNQRRDLKLDMENGSMISGVSGSLSAKSFIVQRQEMNQRINQQSQQNQANSKRALATGSMGKIPASGRQHKINHNNSSLKGSETQQSVSGRQLETTQRYSNLSYATIEEVFNRKIILEKERDKLKKEVEMVIIECDRLQQKYKKRDEILDKLFDGRTGNGLENHLEQQLNWLMEQKHYVDQVFYAWKRAETLTSQTCEQFAQALELLKRLVKTQNEKQRNELSQSICDLLMKSHQDMEQAQRYNPNVDAPFFTDAETERFNKIIETIQSSSVSPSEYSQMANVVQFAYKRAVSIRLWLEQILQITIARDSFELAEEYKWIAIQLRKERISLINVRLHEPPYKAMVQQIHEQLTSQQHRQHQLDHSRQSATTDGVMTAVTRNRQNEVNRDSGIESDGIDIEEDIYRLLEMNKSRLEAAVAASREAGVQQTIALDASGRPVRPPMSLTSTSGGSGAFGNLQQQQQQQQLSVAAGRNSPANSIRSSQHDQIMRERIQRRVRGEQPLASSQSMSGGSGMMPTGGNELGSDLDSQTVSQDASNFVGKQAKQDAGEPRPLTDSRGPDNLGSRKQDAAVVHSDVSSTPTKLRIELDEESRRSLLKQVDQIHSKHRNKLDNLRGNNKAKANDILMRMQSSKQQDRGEEHQQQQQQ